MNIQDLLIQGGYWLINKTMAREIGLDETFLFSDLLTKFKYFKEIKQTVVVEGEHYFFATAESIENDTTFTYFEQKRIMKKLQDIGLINIKKMGIPAKLYFNINLIKLYELFNASIQETSILESSNIEYIINNNSKKNNIMNKYNNTHTLKNQILNQTLDFVEENYKDAFYEYLQFKKDQFKFEYKSESSLKKAYNELLMLSDYNPEQAKLIVNQSIVKGWKGLFNLKEVNNVANNQSISKSNDKELSSYERSRRLTVSQVETSRNKFISKFKNADSFS